MCCAFERYILFSENITSTSNYSAKINAANLIPSIPNEKNKYFKNNLDFIQPLGLP